MDHSIQFSHILDVLLNLFNSIYDVFIDIFNFFTLPLTDVLEMYDYLWLFNSEDIYKLVIERIQDFLGIDGISLLMIMFGVGLPIYLIWQFVTWLLNIIT